MAARICIGLTVWTVWVKREDGFKKPVLQARTRPAKVLDFGGCAIAYPPYKSWLAKVLTSHVKYLNYKSYEDHRKIMTNKEYRNFGLIMAGFISLLFGLLFPWLFTWEFSFIPFVISTALILWSFISPKTLVILYKPWMKLGKLLGFINTRIILGIVFFAIFTPFAMVLKIMKKDAMKRQFNDKKNASYWEKSTQQDKQQMEKIY